MTSSQGGYAYETLADGSTIPQYDTQSPKTPFQVGKVQTLGERVYGYSGIVNFDITAAATYPMLTFALDRTVEIEMAFSADWDLMAASAVSIGPLVTIDGVTILRNISVDFNNMGTSSNPYIYTFVVPAGRTCAIAVVNNPNGVASALLIQSNIILRGIFV